MRHLIATLPLLALACSTPGDTEPQGDGGGGDESSTANEADGGVVEGGDGDGDAGDGDMGDGDGDGDTGDGEVACVGEPVVHFTYFVEADQEYDAAEQAAIEAFALEFQSYFYEQLGQTFYLSEPIVTVVNADHEGQWYVDTPDGIHNDDRWYRLGNIKNEVYAKLGFSNFDPLHRVVNYPTSRHDGRVGVNFGGAWMDGDDLRCMLGDNGGETYPYPDRTPAHCMGHPAHEFGHVLGLAHTGVEEDCMQVGFYNTVGGEQMCFFGNENVAEVLADPDNEGWLNALPGERCVPAS